MIRTNKYRSGLGWSSFSSRWPSRSGSWILAEAFKMGLDFTRHAFDRLDDDAARRRPRDHRLATCSRALPCPTKQSASGSNRARALSDLRFDRMNNTGQGWYPPKGGFFRIISPASKPLKSMAPTTFTRPRITLHFTSILPATDRNPYSVNAPAGGSVSYSSRARPRSATSRRFRSSDSPGRPARLYYLVRRQRLAA